MAAFAPQSSYQSRLDLETSLSRMAAQVESQLAGAITAFERRDALDEDDEVEKRQKFEENRKAHYKVGGGGGLAALRAQAAAMDEEEEDEDTAR